VADFSTEWGILAYAVAAAWAFMEGETFVLLAAAAARATGLLNPWILVGAVWLGSYGGDQLWFALGRRFGVGVVRRFPGGARHLTTVNRFIERHGTLFVLGFRFAYGIRNIAAAACGTTGMSRLRFAVLNFIAAGLWAASFVAGGWFLGGWLGPRGVGWLAGLVGLGFVLVLAWRFTRRRAIAVEPAV
jgi:membrane protein DedA with SNARE-associated domain